jgi:MFS family permease
MENEKISNKAKMLIAVAALGYFVDVYDLILFSVVRNPSLMSLGLRGDELLNQGLNLMNVQMGGMLIGGILWGIYGDKKGRKSVLFGSILLYSLANALNGFVTDLNTYALLRFIAGIGLAGELGAGITLVNETLPPSKRGIGTLIIAGVGAAGAVFAPIIAGLSPDPEWWRTCYFIGGGMGLALLLLRLGTFESSMYAEMDAGVEKGNFFQLFSSAAIFKKYLYCILMGLPIWYIIGILVFSAPEISKLIGIDVLLPGLGDR